MVKYSTHQRSRNKKANPSSKVKHMALKIFKLLFLIGMWFEPDVFHIETYTQSFEGILSLDHDQGASYFFVQAVCGPVNQITP